MGLLLFFCLSSTAYSSVLPEDFGCRGIMLGGSADTAEKILGSMLFDNERSVFGQKIKYCTFRHGYVIGVDKDNKVVDIIVTDRDYIGRDGVRYGATPAKIARVFGIVKRQFMDGTTWYIFDKEGQPEYRLMLEADNDTKTLRSWRITSLPLTYEEAEARERHDDEWQSNDFNAVMLRNKDIDMTAIAKVRNRN